MNGNKKPDSSTSDIDSDSLFSSEMQESDEVSSTSQYNCLEIVEETEALETDSITETIDIRISPQNSTVELMTFQCADDFPSEFSYVADVEVKMNEDQECVVSTTQNSTVKDLLTGDESNTMEVKMYEVRSKESLREFPRSKKLAKKDTGSIENENDPGTSDDVAQSSSVSGTRKCAATGMKKDPRESNGFTVESKIAQEIKEMKQREEEIRKMREMMTKEKPLFTAPIITPEVVKPPQVPIHTEKIKCTPSSPKIVTGGQSYNIASVFATKRKDPSSLTKACSQPSSTFESPIDRDIRMARQREEELKKERELALKMKYQMETCQQSAEYSEDEKDGTLDNLTSVSMCSDSSLDSEPKASSLYDASPVSLNNKLNAIYSNSSNISQSENINVLQKTFSQSKDPFMRSPSPDSSSSSSISKSSPFYPQKAMTSSQGKNVNMERFIASKGREIAFKSPVNSVTGNQYFEIKPPQIKKGDQMSQRKFQSAASKIQSELQEMKEREDELKKERAQLLNGANCDSSSETSKDICSSSDISEEGKISPENEKEETATSSTRRKSALIEEWERRIKSFGVQV
ncbi:serine-rich adhesin for platelets [Parasteatoda tepidariorum]|uniref:serine-rich adhesin for platelets n=1 Tax=Parasteatoda tepidariorum TaxID=114398 RepID=UPI00077FCC6B|nr:uncharacterized protein LOC107442105 [Parasteatoda tepidariorum]